MAADASRAVALPMFESVRETWDSYCSLMVRVVPENDVRLDLAAEINTRLRQLDIILKHLSDARNAIAPDPLEVERADAWFRENHAARACGEISDEEWVAGTQIPFPGDSRTFFDAHESITLFSESFYFFAWRLMGALNMKKFPKTNRFPRFREIKAKGVTFVRNKLIEHPEESPFRRENFTQGLVVTDSGPVLRTTGAAVKVATGEVVPAGDTEDEGLDVTAGKLRDELQENFDQAVRSLTSELGKPDGG